VERLHEPAGRDGQPEALAEQRGDLAEREAQLLIEHDRERDGVGAELRGGGAEGIRGLQRMSALDAVSASPALSYGNVKRPHAGPHHRQIFLILHRVPRQGHGATARRTGRRQRGVVRLIDVGGRGAMAPTPVCHAGFPSGAARWTRRGATRKGRGLAMQRTPRIIELVFEPVDLPLQLVPLLAIPVAVLIGPLMLASQSLDLALLSFQLGDQLVARRRAPFRAEHVSLMPRFGREYTRKLRRSRRSDGGSERITR
jgi:hypothetical protein